VVLERFVKTLLATFTFGMVYAVMRGQRLNELSKTQPLAGG
jgi:hypothetical protein